MLLTGHCASQEGVPQVPEALAASSAAQRCADHHTVPQAPEALCHLEHIKFLLATAQQHILHQPHMGGELQAGAGSSVRSLCMWGIRSMHSTAEQQGLRQLRMMQLGLT